MKSLVSNVTTAVLFSMFSLVAGAQHYDELRDEKGKVRPQYEDVLPYIEALSKKEKKEFLKDSLKAFGGDNMLSPLPRILTAEEYDQKIVKGVQQRGKAIMAFLKDHYSGKRTYGSVVPQNVIERIISRNNEIRYAGLIRPEVLAFPYGPDVIRDAKGTWRVIEDNPGFIGGPGDLKIAQKYLFENVPGLQQAANARNPDLYYRQLAQSFKERAEKMGGKPVLLLSGMASDSEDGRIIKIFAENGIEAVFPKKGDLRLTVESDGVYTYSDKKGLKKTAEKVGFVILNGEHAWFDPTHPAAWERGVIEEAREMLENSTSEKQKAKIQAILDQPRTPKQIHDLDELLERYADDPMRDLRKSTKSYHGLVDAILAKKVATNYAPGVDFIGDKEFYIYVEDLIRHYLGEEPILKNIETVKFADNEGRLIPKTLDHVLENLKTFVVKRVDGRGGKSVWIGPKMTKEEVKSLRSQVLSEPDFYIAQKYTPPSILDGNIVDIRAISDVSNTKVTVANTGWGRGIPKDGDGKVNLSANGREFTILVREPVPPQVRMCRKAFAN